MKKFMIFTIIAFYLQSARATNCTYVVHKETEGLLNYLARVTFPAPFDHVGQWQLKMETDVPYTFLGGWGVWINTIEDEGRAIFKSKDENLQIKQNDTISFRFRISWFTNEPKPEVIRLKWEDTVICQSTGISARKLKRRRYVKTQGTMQVRRRTNVQSG